MADQAPPPQPHGELAERSFEALFRHGRGRKTAFVHLGSGSGALAVAAVERFGCCFALGVEPDRSLQALCAQRVAQLPEKVQARLQFVQAQGQDADLAALLADRQHRRVLVFIDRLPWHGVNRSASGMQQLEQLATEISSRPKLAQQLKALVAAQRKDVLILSMMTLPNLHCNVTSCEVLQMSGEAAERTAFVYTISAPDPSRWQWRSRISSCENIIICVAVLLTLIAVAVTLILCLGPFKRRSGDSGSAVFVSGGYTGGRGGGGGGGSSGGSGRGLRLAA